MPGHRSVPRDQKREQAQAARRNTVPIISLHNQRSSMPNTTGHENFDQWRKEFSVTIRKIEALLHENKSDGTNNAIDSLMRKASSLLGKLSSTTKSVSEPILQQELIDVYTACKMQLKTYKSLTAQQQQPERFDDENNTNTNTNTTTTTTKRNETSERSELFSSAAASSHGGDSNGHKNTPSQKDRITANTQGRVMAQNSRLQDALASLRETEEVASEITGELHGQRETLETTKGRLEQFGTMNEYSKTLLNSMNKPWWRKW